MRKRIFEIIEKAEGDDKVSAIYDVFMIITIFISVVPLAIKRYDPVLKYIDRVTVAIFIIDLLSILPSLTIVNKSFKLLRLLRMLRAMRVMRIFKSLRYSKNFMILGNVLKKSKNSLSAVGILALVYYSIEKNCDNDIFVVWNCNRCFTGRPNTSRIYG